MSETARTGQRESRGPIVREIVSVLAMLVGGSGVLVSLGMIFGEWGWALSGSLVLILAGWLLGLYEPRPAFRRPSELGGPTMEVRVRTPKDGPAQRA